MKLNVGSEALHLMCESFNATKEGFSLVTHQGKDFLWAAPTLTKSKKKDCLEYPPEIFKIIHMLHYRLH